MARYFPISTHALRWVDNLQSIRSRRNFRVSQYVLAFAEPWLNEVLTVGTVVTFTFGSYVIP
jgi:hypothetical protein